MIQMEETFKTHILQQFDPNFEVSPRTFWVQAFNYYFIAMVIVVQSIQAFFMIDLIGFSLLFTILFTILWVVPPLLNLKFLL